MSEEKFEQVFQVSGPAHLIVKNIRGSVDIQPGEDGIIQVIAVKHTESGDAKRTEVELTQETDGTVKAVARFPEGSIDWLFSNKPCKVDFVVRAPRKCTLKVSGVSNDAAISGFDGEFSLNSISGDLTLSDLTGELSVNTVSGEVELAVVDGKLKLHTVSGNIKGQKTTGSVSLNTVSGDVHLSESSLSTVQAESVSGNLELQTPLGEGPYRFHSVSGEVRLTVPAGTRCSAELHSISGRISTNLPQSYNSRHHGTEMVAVQGGGVMISLKSVSGDLFLDGDGEISPMKTVSSEERLAVLGRVKSGEITVEEALSQLHG
ncbi:MAG TPA: hypothetical protein DEO88_03340 [Syntrophobacteraceae bacterium]|nr:hypothetical protein [Syntrophobacteraceae bacterium]